MQINFIDDNKFNANSNEFNTILLILTEKEPDKFINVLKLTDFVVIKDKSYAVDYISVIPAELEAMFSRINIYVHEIEEW